MLPELNKIKGVHPGQVLERELIKMKVNKSAFALEIKEYPSVISEVTKMKRSISASLSYKLENALKAEEGYFLALQAYYEAKSYRNKFTASFPKPNMNLIRKTIFWDIDPDRMDFQKRKRYVIERVFERGNETEISEIIRFYGIEDCKYIIRSARTLMASAIKNAKKYLKINKADLACFNTSTGKPPQKPYF